MISKRNAPTIENVATGNGRAAYVSLVVAVVVIVSLGAMVMNGIDPVSYAQGFWAGLKL